MNAKRVCAAAGVIFAAQQTRQTAAGIAAALESAQLLQSPETAAELARLREDCDALQRDKEHVAAYAERLRARVAELERERHSTNAAVAEAHTALASKAAV